MNHLMNDNNWIRIIPLGGLGDIGKNMMVVETSNDILIIDSGVLFPDSEMPGADLVLPDMNYIKKNSNKVRGLLITHGHEDHIGSVPYLLEHVNVPIYAPPFASELIYKKLKKSRIKQKLNLIPITVGDQQKIGDFFVEWFSVCHSIPDSTGLLIDTPKGKIIHTGDFKIDHNPILGNPSNLAELADISSPEVLLLMADSTNADDEGYSGSDREVFTSLLHLISNAKGRVFISSFASHIARIQMVFLIAKLCNRKVAFSGRSMIENAKISQELGHLSIPEGVKITLPQALSLSEDQVVIITTGSQGEPTSSLVKMASKTHKEIKIKKGDTIIISASIIPGNEVKVYGAIDSLVRQGAHVITNSHAKTHASGHASSEELRLLINLLNPHYFVPIHGDYRMLKANLDLAIECGVHEKNGFLLTDGDVLEITGKKGQIVDKIPIGENYIDGNSLADDDSSIFEERIKLSKEGIVVVSFGKNKFSGKFITSMNITSVGFKNPENATLIFQDLKNELKQLLDQEEGELLHLKEIKRIVENKTVDFIYKRTKKRPVVVITNLDI